MATYNFETITAAQALAFTTNDVVLVNRGTATEATVIFNPAVGGQGPTFSVTLGGQTVVFPPAAGSVALTSRIIFTDESRLYIGDANSNRYGDEGDLHNSAMFGGAGDDHLRVDGGQNLIQANAGNDTLLGLGGRHTMYGGQGDDQISVIGANNYLQGNKGNDLITGSVNADTILGGQGNDTLQGSGGADFLNGNLGDDILIGSGELFGEGGADTLTTSSAQHDDLYGGAGDDRLRTAGGGHDLLDGGDGDDILVNDPNAGGVTFVGGSGNDIIFAHSGQNSVDAGAGDDTITDSAMRITEVDTVHGGAGDDVITALPGQSAQFETFGPAHLIYGDEGDDRISLGRIARATIDGGAGNDTLYAGAGAPFASAGNYAFGGDGDDSISGGLGSYMDGGAGNDTIQGAVQSELGGTYGVFMTGGGGEDVFIFGVNSDITPRSGAQVVTDWSAMDHLSVPGLTVSQIVYSEMTATSVLAAVFAIGGALPNHVIAVQIGQDVVVFADAFTTPGRDYLSPMTLVGRSLNDIDASNFI